jgi:hypothetical protein
MGHFNEYCKRRELDEGLWMNDEKAIVGLSRIQPPKPVKPIKVNARPEPHKPFKPKPINPLQR